MLQTSRLDEMRTWYCTLLDGHVVFEGHGLSFVTSDEEHQRIAFLSPPVPLADKSPTAAGMHHVAYTFDSLDGLLDRYSELKTQGKRRAPVQHAVTTSRYYRDPDGNHVELQVDNFATPDEATGYLEGPEYAADPIGVSFEPEKMLAARAGGTSEAQLCTRAWAPAASPGPPNPLGALTS
jgi:catechol 2,3-dioxygenase-like lactoylglutathione lyase family enzyme